MESLGAECPGCLQGAPRNHPSHVPDRCRWTLTGTRQSAPKVGEARAPKRPTGAGLPVRESDEAVGEGVGLPMRQLDTPETFQRKLVDAPVVDRPLVPAVRSDARVPAHQDTSAGDRDGGDLLDLEAEDDVARREAGGAVDSNRELSAQRRNRVTKTESGTQADEQGADWSDWSIGRAMRLLRSPNIMIIRRTLRRLHVRMWHAPAKRLKELLTTAGAPQKALDEVQLVVDTCPTCRHWARPGLRPMTSSSVVTDLNAEIQFDLLFWKDHIVCHCIDVCVRFSLAEIIEDRLTTTILSSITRLWIRMFGPPRRLISDNEGALNSDEGRTWASRWNIELEFRPRSSHARIVEKHNDLLRKQLHLVDEQCSRDGINVPDDCILAECVLAHNALVS